jgi:pimeloyl-ACP methyl ester carboxylesterase
VHLLGWSWGGMLALEYVLSRRPAGVESLVLASAPASAPLWRQEARRLRDQLPGHVIRAMERFESSYRPPRPPRPPPQRPAQAPTPTRVRRGVSPATAHVVALLARAGLGLLCRPGVVRLAAAASVLPPLRRAAYEVVNIEYIRRHVMRGHPHDAPLSVFRSFAGMNRQVYEAMWGPSELLGQGLLRDWDVVDRLGEITVPTLVTSGRHDEATPLQMQILADGIPEASWVVFEHSAHGALLEEPLRYRAVVSRFLDAVDASGPLSNAEEAGAPSLP